IKYLALPCASSQCVATDSRKPSRARPAGVRQQAQRSSSEFPSMRAPEVVTKLPGRPGSCWTITAPNNSYPKLTGSQTVDVAVVGAGIVGATAAYLLCEAGFSVALLEARRIGRQVTGRSTAKITTQHSLIYRHLIRTFDLETARHYADANRLG